MPVTTSERPTLGVAQTPYRRATKSCVLGGVCGGLAVRLGVRERTLRVMFCLGVFVFGAGLVAYVTLWLIVPRSGEDDSIVQRVSTRPRQSRLFIMIVVGALIVVGTLYLRHQGRFGNLFVPLALSAAGLVAVGWGATSDEQRHLGAVLRATPLRSISNVRGGRAVLWRIVPGVVLVVVGLKVISGVGGVWGAAVPAIIGAGALLGGVLVLFAPWWLQTALDLSSERRQRVRAEERSAMVTHLHDSVLQTLTLIERVADNDGEVRRLARKQERELREWLYSPNDATGGGATFASLLRDIEADVEDDYGISIELVIVGDCRATADITAMTLAGREAVLNSAKWSGATVVSVFAEVEPTSLSIFVRDTGSGFDRSTVPVDRHGITASIEARMAGIGGVATLTSTPGVGTEVELVLERRGN